MISEILLTFGHFARRGTSLLDLLGGLLLRGGAFAGTVLFPRRLLAFGITSGRICISAASTKWGSHLAARKVVARCLLATALN